MVRKSSHCGPLLVGEGGLVTIPNRVRLGRNGDKRDREAYLQSLVHDHPEVIPMEDIEPAFVPLVSVCTELPTRTGSVDNLWIPPTGAIVIGECKLVRNNQARREVLVQALDYARELADWHYEDLEGAVRKALGNEKVGLYELVCNKTEEGDIEDEPVFCNAIERNLRHGRLLVLLILDGVRDGLETLTEHLQLHSGLHVGLAIVELSIWQTTDKLRLVVPRVPMHTILVERGVVTVDEVGRVRVDAPRQPTDGIKPANRFTNSEEEFYSRLSTKNPSLTASVRDFARHIENLGVIPEYRRSLVLRWHASNGVVGSLGYIDAGGAIWVGDALSLASKLGNRKVGEQYVADIVRIGGGKLKTYPDGNVAIVGRDRKILSFANVAPAKEQWVAAIQRFLSELKKLEQENE